MQADYTGQNVFISHAGPQKDGYALPLWRALCNRGVTTFVDERDLPPGGSSGQHMEAACRKAKLVVFMITRDFLRRACCMVELRWALHQRRSVGDRRLPEILPVFLPVSDEPGGGFFNVDDLSPLSDCTETQLQRSRPDGISEAEWAEECQRNLADLQGFCAIRSDAYPSRCVHSCRLCIGFISDPGMHAFCYRNHWKCVEFILPMLCLFILSMRDKLK